MMNERKLPFGLTPLYAPKKPVEKSASIPLEKPQEESGIKMRQEVGAEPLNMEHLQKDTVNRTKLLKDVFERQKNILTSLYTDIVLKQEGASVAIEEMEKAETMMAGKIINEHLVTGDAAGVNKTKMLTFEGDLIGFGKELKGETIIKEGGKNFVWDQQAGAYKEDEKQEQADPGDREMMSPEYRKKLFKTIQEHYKLSDEELKQVQERNNFGEASSPRADIPPNESAIREMAVSQLSAILGLKRFPQTVLRKEGDEMMSVQEAARSEKNGEMLKSLTVEEMNVLFKSPPAEWKKRFGEQPAKKLEEGIYEGAIASELFGFADCTFGNMLGNTRTGELAYIDSALSFPLTRGLTIPGETEFARKNRALRSTPIEIMMKNPEMQFTDKQIARLQQVHDDIHKGGPTNRVVQEIFKTLSKNVKIAQELFLDFMVRLRLIIQNKKPLEKVILPIPQTGVGKKQKKEKWESPAKDALFPATDWALIAALSREYAASLQQERQDGTAAA